MTYWYFKNNELQYSSDGVYMTPEAGYVVVSSEEQVDATKTYELVDGKITITGDAPPPPNPPIE
tara:strand:+ start:261 stop:452 length:192 start_codon:yes stop_codon:yes gene_type:complete